MSKEVLILIIDGTTIIGGKMWAENNSEGKGATFTFSLPID